MLCYVTVMLCLLCYMLCSYGFMCWGPWDNTPACLTHRFTVLLRNSADQMPTRPTDWKTKQLIHASKLQGAVPGKLLWPPLGTPQCHIGPILGSLEENRVSQSRSGEVIEHFQFTSEPSFNGLATSTIQLMITSVARSHAGFREWFPERVDPIRIHNATHKRRRNWTRVRTP